MSNGAIYQTIHLHPLAPPKPALGAACNGCGVCCASEPCPIGVLISRRRSGRCNALLWQADPPRHVCGVLSAPERFSGIRSSTVNAMLRVLAARSIAAGIGCDADTEVVADQLDPRDR